MNVPKKATHKIYESLPVNFAMQVFRVLGISNNKKYSATTAGSAQADKKVSTGTQELVQAHSLHSSAKYIKDSATLAAPAAARME